MGCLDVTILQLVEISTEYYSTVGMLLQYMVNAHAEVTGHQVVLCPWRVVHHPSGNVCGVPQQAVGSQHDPDDFDVVVVVQLGPYIDGYAVSDVTCHTSMLLPISSIPSV